MAESVSPPWICRKGASVSSYKNLFRYKYVIWCTYMYLFMNTSSDIYVFINTSSDTHFPLYLIFFSVFFFWWRIYKYINIGWRIYEYVIWHLFSSISDIFFWPDQNVICDATFWEMNLRFLSSWVVEAWSCWWFSFRFLTKQSSICFLNGKQIVKMIMLPSSLEETKIPKIKSYIGEKSDTHR